MTTTQRLVIEDDRTPEQRKTHRIGVIARDRFMSGWGRAEGITSHACWACATEEHADKLLAWVGNRKEMRNVRVVDLARTPRVAGHLRVYVVDDGHPVLR